MSSEKDKAVIELMVFSNFISLAGLPIKQFEKRSPPEPDLVCTHATEGMVAFELVELCDSNLARSLADPRPNLDGVEYIRTSDPSFEIVRSKLLKNYETAHPIELLCYTNGRVITPIDVIIPTIGELLDSFNHKFRRVWLLSERKVFKIWE